MPTAGLIEKVARAIYEKRNGPGCYAWGLRPKAHKEPYLSDARAALSAVAEAMREPTEEMDRAGSSEDLHYCPGNRFAHWSAMLAASPLGKGE